jgi:hypothetical protein
LPCLLKYLVCRQIKAWLVNSMPFLQLNSQLGLYMNMLHRQEWKSWLHSGEMLLGCRIHFFWKPPCMCFFPTYIFLHVIIHKAFNQRLYISNWRGGNKYWRITMLLRLINVYQNFFHKFIISRAQAMTFHHLAKKGWCGWSRGIKIPCF